MSRLGGIRNWGVGVVDACSRRGGGSQSWESTVSITGVALARHIPTLSYWSRVSLCLCGYMCCKSGSSPGNSLPNHATIWNSSILKSVYIKTADVSPYPSNLSQAPFIKVTKGFWDLNISLFVGYSIWLVQCNIPDTVKGVLDAEWQLLFKYKRAWNFLPEAWI